MPFPLRHQSQTKELIEYPEYNYQATGLVMQLQGGE